jgi:pyruvate/2-oxoglutarate/acetoin dehydrogenase E1 component
MGIIELPTSDSSNGGVMVGFALAGRKPIYISRYQGFMTYNAASLVNYAAKSKDMWQTPCPIFIRSIGMEGKIGPVAGGMNHHLRYPGLKVYAPMTPGEWTECWNDFLQGDDPVYCSEHRASYKNTEEMPMVDKQRDVTTILIGPFNPNLRTNFIHLFRLKPLRFTQAELDLIKRSKLVVVVDSEPTICGASEHVACEINKMGGRAIAVGMEDRTAGFGHDVLSPTQGQVDNAIRNYIQTTGLEINY